MDRLKNICDFLHFFEVPLKFQVIKEDTNLTELKTEDRSAPFSLIYNCSIAPSSEEVGTHLLCLKIFITLSFIWTYIALLILCTYYYLH